MPQRRPPIANREQVSLRPAADVRPNGPHWEHSHADNAAKRCRSRQTKKARLPAAEIARPFGKQDCAGKCSARVDSSAQSKARTACRTAAALGDRVWKGHSV
jgi:hypothetical protein